MTLDEAIEINRNNVEINRKNADKEKERNNYELYQTLIECAEGNEQYAEWLEELKKYREMDIVHCKDCKHWGTGIAGETENVKCCEYGKYMVGMNGYCVYGEKECAE